METLGKTLFQRNSGATVGKYLTFVRFSKKQKQRKVETRSTHVHLRTLIHQKDITSCDRALNYFNVYYGKFYGKQWQSIRLGLLSRPKHVALINNFSNPKETEHQLALQGCSNIFPEYIRSSNSVNEPFFGQNEPSVSEDNLDDDFENREGIASMKKDEVNQRLIAPHQKISIRGESLDSMYEFVPVTQLKGMEDFVEESEHYESYSKLSEESDFPLQFWKERLNFIPFLRAFAFPRGDISRFPAPRADFDGLYNYYCMDASSLLPVLSLGLKRGDEVLDLCSGPGGKALAICQTHLPTTLVCNDASPNRLKRVRNVFSQYFGETSPYEDLNIEFTCADGEDYFMENESRFDKVLCDVPCFTDRVVLNENENNIFNPKKNKERIRLPQLQIELLKSALLCVKPGGYVVYSTCTLSPTQNDGVVHGALKELWEDGKVEFAICDLSDAVEPLKEHIQFGDGTRYGQQIVPVLYNNFGPMYFAKIKRLHQRD